MVNRLTDQVFYIRENDDWVLKRTQDIFNDKEVVVLDCQEHLHQLARHSSCLSLKSCMMTLETWV